ncbi:fungal-specific transcription factor domain-containing protein [Phaeosphaeriaceae sp. PMI808]|nr:fungal-specific transcription factor domain-containing protein [Phaeosphaeriaceae sp. PMI808]
MFSTLTSDMSVIDSRSQGSGSNSQSKRAQVARACDFCRTNRIKCDEDLPCTQCRQRGLQCGGSSKLAGNASLPAANRYNQRLKERIKELESQLKQKLPEDSGNSKSMTGLATHAQTAHIVENQEGSTQSEYGHTKLLDEPPKAWKEVALGPARDGPLPSGPLSLAYLVTRLQCHLCRTLDRLSLDFSVTQIAEPTSDPTPFPPPEGVHVLSRTEEELFLYPLWESFHPIYPILSYEDFHLYYDGLWASPPEGQPRHPSALIDSLLAVCTQYCSTFMHDDVGGLEDSPVTRVGYPYYFRSQTLLMKELESPSITTVQAFVYCIIYLYNSSLLNTAYHILGIAVRVTQTLHLDFKPLLSTPPEQQGPHARIWWTLYQLDMVISTSLDRPFLVHLEDVPCSLPEDIDMSLNPCSNPILRTAAHPDINWISFHVQYVRLAAIFHGLYSVLQKQSTKMRQGSNSFDIHDDPNALEELAILLDCESHVMQDWVRAVPKSLKVRRQGDSEPLSTDRVSLNLDSASPIWLQRQQLLLELTYHDFQLSIYRPFLRITLKSSSFQPRTDRMGLNALFHALAITNILQALSGTEILRGWLPLLRLQWNAALCILCFIIGNPICPFTAAARKGLQTAIQTLEIMGNYYPAAHGAVSIARHLMSLGEALTAEYRRGIDPRGFQRTPSEQSWPQGQHVSSSSSELPLFGQHVDNFPYSTLPFDMSRPMSASNLDITFPFTPPQTASSQIAHMLPDSTMSQQMLNSAMVMSCDGNDKQG